MQDSMDGTHSLTSHTCPSMPSSRVSSVSTRRFMDTSRYLDEQEIKGRKRASERKRGKEGRGRGRGVGARIQGRVRINSQGQSC